MALLSILEKEEAYESSLLGCSIAVESWLSMLSYQGRGKGEKVILKSFPCPEHLSDVGLSLPHFLVQLLFQQVHLGNTGPFNITEWNGIISLWRALR